jgi:hypothetical protein
VVCLGWRRDGRDGPSGVYGGSVGAIVRFLSMIRKKVFILGGGAGGEELSSVGVVEMVPACACWIARGRVTGGGRGRSVW